MSQLGSIALLTVPGAIAFTPEFTLATGRYSLRLACNAHEIALVQRLRFNVFNLELHEGLADSFRTGLDEDEFDAQCAHLLVTEKQSGAVIGTYRLQTNEAAANGRGFYSAGLFELDQLPGEVLANGLELGRACIAREHRHTEVLLLLWRGIATYLRQTGKRYLFGCCSLNSQDVRAGWALRQQLGRGKHLHRTLFVPPRPGFEGELPDSYATASPDVQMPKLLRSYLRFGAKVCGPPALDQQFGTIDFFVLLDVETLNERARQLLFAESAGE